MSTREIIVTDAEMAAAPPGSDYSGFLLGTGVLADPRKLLACWVNPVTLAKHFVIERAEETA